MGVLDSTKSITCHSCRIVKASLGTLWFLAFCYICLEVMRYLVERNQKSDNSFDVEKHFGPETEILMTSEETGGIVRMHSRIIFFETAQEGTLTIKQLIAVESAAMRNPNMTVTVYLFSASGKINLTEPMKQIRDKYQNVKYEGTKIEQFVKGTELSAWFKDNKWSKSKFKQVHLSEGLRYLELHRAGGIYLDLDMITLLDFLNLPENALTMESTKFVAASFMAFRKEHPFMLRVLRNFVSRYNPDIYVYNGAYLVTQTYLDNRDLRYDVEVLPESTFNPVVWEEGRDWFNENKTGEVLRKAFNSRCAHWWSDLNKAAVLMTKTQNAFVKLVEENCPVLFSEIKKKGWD